jgi:hypothetical protein
VSGFGPPILKSSMRSWNWPWMSPQTVTGHFWFSTSARNIFERALEPHTTGCTLDSSCKTSRAYKGSISTPCSTRSRERGEGQHQPLSRQRRVKIAISIPSAVMQTSLEMHTNLLAKPLNVGLGQLLAGHQALDPAIEGGDGSRLQVLHWRHVRRDAPDILHGGIHAIDAVRLYRGRVACGCREGGYGVAVSSSRGISAVVVCMRNDVVFAKRACSPLRGAARVHRRARAVKGGPMAQSGK